jgi:pimeloyl-ACP methyl ester carboxylesterase
LSAAKSQSVPVGEGDGRRDIAFLRRAPHAAGAARPGLVWLCGFKSDMASTKASALDAWCAEQGRALLRFDYSGHGASGGRFEDGTLSRWLDESLALIRQQTKGPQIFVGSSMGGYLALLAARALAASGEDARLAGLVLIAPAVDFTEALLWAALPDSARRSIMKRGQWLRPTPYAPKPYPITRALIEDGRKHLLLQSEIRTHGPVRILQGMRDEDVPWRHAAKLMERIASDEASLTLVKDGDHRLSRPQDIVLMFSAIEEIA